ncbi:helix-turn-helix domain-containing protein [Kitasatospora sp. HPMI-4]|uniref:helix-turn-helix domain-containing protein n=1 Tax=Kitasatospora sp. HPMI-4 TaxID=3448443 RepID=UPI003F1CC088
MVNPKELDPSESPQAFYGAELRRIRLAKGLSQEALGALVFCSGAYIGQMESATRQPQKDLSERLDVALGTDGHFARLYPMVTRSRFADYFTAVRELQEMARTIYEYDPVLVPGLLQTPEYARAVFRSFDPLRLEVETDELVSMRIERAHILHASTRPRYWVVLDESTLRRVTGGAAVMHGQMAHLAQLMRGNRIVLQVLPFSAGGHPLMQGSLTLMTFADAPPVAYGEGPYRGQLIDDPAYVENCRWAYDLVRSAALSLEASLALIEAAAEDYASEQD